MKVFLSNCIRRERERLIGNEAAAIFNFCVWTCEATFTLAMKCWKILLILDILLLARAALRLEINRVYTRFYRELHEELALQCRTDSSWHICGENIAKGCCTSHMGNMYPTHTRVNASGVTRTRRCPVQLVHLSIIIHRTTTLRRWPQTSRRQTSLGRELVRAFNPRCRTLPINRQRSVRALGRIKRWYL